MGVPGLGGLGGLGVPGRTTDCWTVDYWTMDVRGLYGFMDVRGLWTMDVRGLPWTLPITGSFRSCNEAGKLSEKFKAYENHVFCPNM